MRLGLCVGFAFLLTCCGSDAGAPEDVAGTGGQPDTDGATAGSAGTAGSGGESGAAGAGGSADSGIDSGGSAGKGGSSGSAGTGGSSGSTAYDVCKDAPNVGPYGYTCSSSCSPPKAGYSAYGSDDDYLYANRCVHPKYCNQSDTHFLTPTTTGLASAVLLGPSNCTLNYKLPVAAESCVKVTVSTTPGSPAWGVSANSKASDDAKTLPRCLVHCYTKPDITYPNQQWLYVRGDFRAAGGGWVKAEMSAWSSTPTLKCP